MVRYPRFKVNLTFYIRREIQGQESERRVRHFMEGFTLSVRYRRHVTWMFLWHCESDFDHQGLSAGHPTDPCMSILIPLLLAVWQRFTSFPMEVEHPTPVRLTVPFTTQPLEGSRAPGRPSFVLLQGEKTLEDQQLFSCQHYPVKGRTIIYFL